MKEEPFVGLDQDFPSEIITHLQECRPKSFYRKFLLKQLANFIKYPWLYLIWQLLIGLVFIGIPCIVWYILLTKQSSSKYAWIIIIVVPILILLLFLYFLIKRICDDKKNKALIFATWERNNVFSFIKHVFKWLVFMWMGICISLTFKKIHTFIQNSDVNAIFCDNFDTEIYYNKLIMGWMYNIIPFSNKLIIDNESKIEICFKENYTMITINNSACYILTPLFIYVICSLIRIIFVKTKFTFGNFLIYLILLCKCLHFIIITHDKFHIYNKDNNNNNNNNSFLQFLHTKQNEIHVIASLLIIFILIISIIYSCILRTRKGRIMKIKLHLMVMIILLIFDICLIIGICILAYSLINLLFINEYTNITWNDISRFVTHIKLLTTLIFLPLCSYFGNNFLILIYKPIVKEYHPAILKNNFYIEKLKMRLHGYRSYQNKVNLV